MSYSLEELAYEFFDHKERDAYANERKEQEDDKIEEDKVNDALAWAEEEEKRDNEQLAAKNAANPTPTVTPDDELWMQHQLEKEKAIHGNEFGEDIVETFDD